MPTYTYECSKCEQQFDIHHPMNGPPVSQYELPENVEYGETKEGLFGLYHLCRGDSPVENRTRMERIISAPAVITIVRGNHDFSVREKARLKKRSQDHWNKVGRTEAIEKAEAKGMPVPTGGLAKAIRKMRSKSA